jgi:tetratricopeptide (TPR) repeat protein
VAAFLLSTLPAFGLEPAKGSLAKPFLEAAKDFERGHYQDAARFYRIMMSSYQGSDWEARAGLYLGQCYEKMGQPEDAAAAYRKVEGLGGKDEALEARFRLASLDEEARDFEAAAKEYQAVAAADPFSGQGVLALMDLAALQGRQKRYEEALKTYERLELLDNQSPWAAREGWMGAAKIYRIQKDYDKALVALDKVIRDSPHSQAGAMALLLKGHCLHQASRYDEAAASYGSLADQYQDWASQALVFEGRSLSAAGRNPEAQQAWQRTADLYPGTLWAEAAGHLLAEQRDGRQATP